MPKKIPKKKRVGKKPTKKANIGPVYTLVENPFGDVPREKLIQGFVEAGQSFAKEFVESLEKLQKLINSVDPFHLLSVLSVYGLFVGLTESGKTKKKKNSFLLQPHVELVQALALRTNYSHLSPSPAIPQKVQEIWDLSRVLGESFAMKRLVQIENSKTEQDKAILYFQERLRSHTHMVRNWGYYRRVIAICKRLFEPLNSVYEDELGISATELIGLFEYMVDNSEKQVNEHWHKFKPVFQSRSIDQAVYAYYNAVPDLEGSPDELIYYFRDNKAPLEAVYPMVLSHYDLRLPEIYTFSVESLAQEKDLDPKGLSNALSKISLSFGDLENANPEHFFLGNPIWMKPLIKVDEANFFCSIPQLFFSFVFRIFNALIDQNKKAQHLCFERRAKFLEDEIFTLMNSSFRNGEYARNFKWCDEKKEYESDLIFNVDSYLIIIEAKSGAISWPALRGAPERMERHIKDLFVDPASQSQRLAEILLKIISKEAEADELSIQLPFQIDAVKKIIRLSVTLEDFATIQSNISSLKSTGWLDDNFAIAPTILLADLEIVFDILSSTPEKIHYLVRRTELEERIHYVGDELDLIGLYLDTCFNLGNIESSQKNMMLIGMSKKIDDYYIAKDQGINRNKPIIKSTAWWRDIRSYIEKRNPDRWSEVAVMLLNVPFEAQNNSQKRFKKIVKNVKKNWRKKGHLNSIVILPPKWRYEAVGFFAFCEANKDDRHASMENLASRIFEESHATRCLIIGINIDKNHYPYSLLGVFDSPNDN